MDFSFLCMCYVGLVLNCISPSIAEIYQEM